MLTQEDFQQRLDTKEVQYQNVQEEHQARHQAEEETFRKELHEKEERIAELDKLLKETTEKGASELKSKTEKLSSENDMLTKSVGDLQAALQTARGLQQETETSIAQVKSAHIASVCSASPLPGSNHQGG